MRARPLRDKYRAAHEPPPLIDYPWRVFGALGILLAVIVLLLFLDSCGSFWYRVGTSFTDHTATTEEYVIPSSLPVPESDTPVISSDPTGMGKWRAYYNHPVYGEIEGYGDTWEEAAADWKQQYDIWRNAPDPKNRKE